MARVKNKINLRNQLGMSQDHFALWLGISRSLMSMHETNLRNLPTDAVFKYSQILKSWQNFGETWDVNGDAQKESPPSQTDLRKIRKLKHKKLKAEFELKKLDDLPDYAKTIAFFTHYLQQTTNEKEQLICRLTIRDQEKERDNVQKKRSALKTDIELINRQLEVLEKKLD
jgi:DNA-binding XRE family transcriptional regulator